MFALIQAAGWPIWPLIICSILALAIILERFISLKSNKIIPPNLLTEVVDWSRKGNIDSQSMNQLEDDSVLGTLLASGLRVVTSNPKALDEDIDTAMETTGRRLAHRLEKHLSALATIASAAPLLGLLGTVVGMIEIFGAQSAGGGGNPVELAHGISVALYNTAFGLIIAIPTLIVWRYFRSRVDEYVLTLELAGERFSRHLKSQRKA